MKYMLGHTKEEQNDVLKKFNVVLRKIVSNFNPGILSREDLYHEALFGLADALKAYQLRKGKLDLNDVLLKKYVYRYVKVRLDDFICKFILQRPRYVIEIKRMFERLAPLSENKIRQILDSKKPNREYRILQNIAARGYLPLSYSSIITLWQRIYKIKPSVTLDLEVKNEASQENFVMLKESLTVLNNMDISSKSKAIFFRWAILGEKIIDLSKDFNLTKSAVSQIIKRVQKKMVKVYKE